MSRVFNRKRPHFRQVPYGALQPKARRCTCGNAVQAGEFCGPCLAKVPADLVADLNYCDRFIKGSDRYTAAVAQVEQFLRMHRA